MAIALVTGGGRGIGRAVALALAADGMRVAICARSAEQLDEVVTASGGAILAVPADLSDSAQIAPMIGEVQRRLGPVDLLVNNAATGGPFQPLWDCDADEWWHCLEVNLRGPFICCREVLPGMIGRGTGRIVNVASGAGTWAVPDLSAYVASKTALIRLSEQIAAEAGPHGVKAFSVTPGIVRTAMVEQARHHIPLIQKQLDDGLESPPEAAADLVRFIASGEADSLSGSVIAISDDYRSLAAAGEVRKLRLQTA